MARGKNDKIVKGTTKSGIKFQIDERIKDDTRLLQLICDAQDKDASDMDKSKALFNLIALIFGGKDGAMEFQNTVASVHDGFCTTSDLMLELNEIFEAVNAKKLQASLTS